MELWIRSQDKECLMKVEGIFIGDLNDWYEKSLSETMDNIIGDGGGYFINDLSNRPLGYYKTEERALEVLNEIQNILTPEFKVWIENKDGIQLDTYVYEMPKE